MEKQFEFKNRTYVLIIDNFPNSEIMKLEVADVQIKRSIIYQEFNTKDMTKPYNGKNIPMSDKEVSHIILDRVYSDFYFSEEFITTIKKQLL